MVIRRGDVTDIAWGFALLEMNCDLSTEDVLMVCHHHAAMTYFDKPQTKSGHL